LEPGLLVPEQVELGFEEAAQQHTLLADAHHPVVVLDHLDRALVAIDVRTPLLVLEGAAFGRVHHAVQRGFVVGLDVAAESLLREPDLFGRFVAIDGRVVVVSGVGLVGVIGAVGGQAVSVPGREHFGYDLALVLHGPGHLLIEGDVVLQIGFELAVHRH